MLLRVAGVPDLRRWLGPFGFSWSVIWLAWLMMCMATFMAKLNALEEPEHVDVEPALPRAKAAPNTPLAATLNPLAQLEAAPAT